MDRNARHARPRSSSRSSGASTSSLGKFPPTCILFSRERETAEISETATFDFDELPTVAHPGRPSYTHAEHTGGFSGRWRGYVARQSVGLGTTKDWQTDAVWDNFDSAQSCRVAQHTQSSLPAASVRRSCWIVDAILRREGEARATATSTGGPPMLRTPLIELGPAVSLNPFAQHADEPVLTLGYSGDKKTKGAALVF